MIIFLEKLMLRPYCHKVIKHNLRILPEDSKLAIIRGHIPEEKEKIFRKLIAEKFGFKKGSLSKGLEEAIDLWIKVNDDIVIENLNYYQLKQELMENSPGKVVAIMGNKAIAAADSLDELEQALIELNIHKEKLNVLRLEKLRFRRRKLGWRITRKRSAGHS